MLFSSTLLPKSLCCLKFSTAHHGIPFLKVALGRVLNMSDGELRKYASKRNNPLWFTVNIVGCFKTMSGFLEQAYRAYRKRR